MTHIGMYILQDGSITSHLPNLNDVLGVIFDETSTEYRFLPFVDIDCYGIYGLDKIKDIVENYNHSHGSESLEWSIPTLADWNLVVNRLGQTETIWKEELIFGDRMVEWTEFDAETAIKNLKKYRLRPQPFYWSSSTEYDDDIYLLNLENGTIEACPIWDDGEDYDYALRLIGHIVKKGDMCP